MSIAYGLAPCSPAVIRWRYQRQATTVYAGQPCILTALGTAVTVGTARGNSAIPTSLYGVFAATKTSTATENAKVPIYVFAPGTLWRGRIRGSASERLVGSAIGMVIQTSIYYRLSTAIASGTPGARPFIVESMDSRVTATTAGRPIIVQIKDSLNRYTDGRNI